MLNKTVSFMLIPTAVLNGENNITFTILRYYAALKKSGIIAAKNCTQLVPGKNTVWA